MNPFIKKLAGLAGKKSRRIIGLMSGTSLDGLDIALCKISGDGAKTSVNLDKFVTVPYSEKIRKLLKQISSVENVQLKEVSYWHTRLAHVHAEMILQTLQNWEVESRQVDCIASHGQTIYHYPARDQSNQNSPVNNTLQIGDGDQIAAKTGILTISDFRQKHVAHGGEGAPMAGLVDRMLFTDSNETRILLNIGGIANFTYLPSKKSSRNKSFTTDTGPGNTLIDSLASHYFQKPFDEDGKIAESGALNERLLDELSSDNWLNERDPKTTGPEYFNIRWFKQKMKKAGIDKNEIQPGDMIRTASELTVRSIVKNIDNHIQPERTLKIYVSGGGANNPFLVKRIEELLPHFQVKNISEIGLTADAKEAVIFAVLANEMLAGEGFEMDTGEGEKKMVNFGKISFPE